LYYKLLIFALIKKLLILKIKKMSNHKKFILPKTNLEQKISEEDVVISKKLFSLYIQKAFTDGKITAFEMKNKTPLEYYHDIFEEFDLSKIEELVTQAHAGDIEVISGVYNGREMTEEEIGLLSQEFIYEYHYNTKF
jgi:hypothetical protein